MHILLLYVPPQFPRCVANSLKSQVDPQIRKTANSLVEALNVKKKSVNQSEKAGFRHRKEQCSIRLQKQAPVKI